MMEDEEFCAALVDHGLTKGTCDMAMRALMLSRRPTPPEIRTAARFFGANWRAVAILLGYAETPEGEWVDTFAEGFLWSSLGRLPTTLFGRGPNGTRYTNQEAAAYALRRTI